MGERAGRIKRFIKYFHKLVQHYKARDFEDSSTDWTHNSCQMEETHKDSCWTQCLKYDISLWSDLILIHSHDRGFDLAAESKALTHSLMEWQYRKSKQKKQFVLAGPLIQEHLWSRWVFFCELATTLPGVIRIANSTWPPPPPHE